jgi:hypothetical protein
MGLHKRGQVAIFIIIGLILLTAVTIFFIFRNQIVELDQQALSDVASEFVLESQYIETCLEMSSHDAVVLNGFKGGLYAPKYHVFGEFRAPLSTFYYKGQVIAPSNEDVARSIALEFNDLFTACIAEYDLDAVVSVGQIQTRVGILNSSIMIDSTYPITFERAGKRQIYRDHRYTVENVRLLLMLDVARQLSYEQTLDPEYICATCALELGDANYMWIDYTDIGEMKTVYTITDLFSSIEGSPYIFMMAHEH